VGGSGADPGADPSADVDALVRPWLADPARAGVLTDFDGTLAPIVPDPATARALPGAVEALERLAGRYGRVAVISGRRASFLAEQFGGADRVPDGLTLIGLYGLERLRDGRVETHPAVDPWIGPVQAATTVAEREAPPGVTVEPKGLSLGLVARAAPHYFTWVESFASRVAASTGLVAEAGKLSYELRPPVAVDKGTVVEELAAGLDAVSFAGDDLGDLPAFAALERLRRGGLTTLGVVARSEETPPEVLAAGDLVVDGPDGVLEIWQQLAG